MSKNTFWKNADAEVDALVRTLVAILWFVLVLLVEQLRRALGSDTQGKST